MLAAAEGAVVVLLRQKSRSTKPERLGWFLFEGTQ